jgi:hypothetical protein
VQLDPSLIGSFIDIRIGSKSDLIHILVIATNPPILFQFGFDQPAASESFPPLFLSEQVVHSHGEGHGLYGQLF